MVIGAGKSGTTALHHYLQQHPQLFVPQHKDPSYLALMHEKPSAAENHPKGLAYYPFAIYHAEEYIALYHKAEPEQLTGDVSTMYLYHKQAAENIRKYRPDAKIIAILRNPADRLYSRYLHLARDGRHPETPLSQLFDRDSIWWKRNDLIYEGFFYQHLKRYFDRFSPDQIKVFLYEDLQSEEKGLIREMYRFLDVAQDFEPETHIIFNQSGFVKSVWKDRLIGHGSILRRTAETLFPSLLNRLRKHPRSQRMVSQMRAQNLHRPVLDADLRARIIKEIYEEDILKLQTLIGRDLSAWLEV